MVSRFIHFLMGVLLSGWVASAAAQTLMLSPEVLPAPEGGTVTNQVLVTPTHRFSLSFPPGWGVHVASTNQTLLLLHPDLRAGIELRLWPQEGQAADELESWLLRLDERVDDAVVVRQFRTRSATAEGWGFDLVRSLDGRTRGGLRVVLVPYDGGMAEFELRAPLDEVPKYYRLLRHLVASFVPRDRTRETGPGRPASTGAR